MSSDIALVERIRLYLAWNDAPEFQPCPRCNGKGYHHGFGERGHDPDWCEKCGGPGEEPTEPGTWCPDDLLREALEALVGGENERLRQVIHETALENMNLRNEITQLKGDPTDLNALLNGR